MLKNIKMGFIYLFAIVLAVAIMYVVDFADKYELSPKEVYKVYLDGKVIGNIKNKTELENYINEEQKELKEKYSVDKVYVPTGVDIQKCTTYEKEILSAKKVHNIIKEEKPFTIKGYKVTINPTDEVTTSEEETTDKKREKIVINVLDKKMFDSAIKTVVKAFVTPEEYNNFKNDTQSEIKETGSLIEDIYIAQNITEKEAFISTDSEIFTDEKTLTKYLMFSELKEDQYYTVQEGDTIETIAYNNKLAPSEFLIVNPEFSSENNLLSPGQQVKVGLINPLVDVIVEKHEVFDQESKYATTTEEDPNMTYGVEKVITEGQNGTDRLTTKIKYDNGDASNVVIVSTETIEPSVSKVVKVGTKQEFGGNYSTVVMSGSYAWPTIAQHYISSPFGYRWGRLHAGIDIAGSGSGSPIFAAGSGTVVSSIADWSVGTNVVINHGNGYYTTYLHLSSKFVKPGATVQKGQQIGTMGSTGRSTGTHLHFGLWIGGEPYHGGVVADPMRLYK